jgi:hypothetical protein
MPYVSLEAVAVDIDVIDLQDHGFFNLIVSVLMGLPNDELYHEERETEVYPLALGHP